MTLRIAFRSSAVVAIVLASLAAVIAAQDRSTAIDLEVADLAAAIVAEVQVDTPAGPVPIAHCRGAGTARLGDGSDRCAARARAFASYFVTAGLRHRVDPWLLAASARQESGFDPWARGPSGEGGIMQLHPRGVGSRVPFVTRGAARRRCAQKAGACQAQIVDVGARHMRAWIDRCGGVGEGLAGYNSGRCEPNRYTRRVLEIRRRMLARGRPGA